jgi:hypothetical protein
MKAFLIAVSLLCFCGILLCFWAYATNRLPGVPVVTSSQQVQISQVALNPDEIGVPPTMEADPLCSPCVEQMAFVLEIVQEWEEDQNSRLETTSPEGVHVHKPPTVESIEARDWDGLSLEQRERAKRLFDQYGTEEGLRRFREMDPKAARRFERERRKSPVPSESGEEPSTR